MKSTITEALRYWIPYKLVDQSDTLLFDWLYTSKEPYTEPFFDATIGKCLQYRRTSKPNKHLSDADSLIEWSGETDHVTPTAFIFHVSRCGSTLLSQALGMNREFISLSEVPVFDSILRLRFHKLHADTYNTGKLLKAAIAFYGSKRTGTEKELFVKTDSWHLMFYEQIRGLYPDVPFIVLYRTPLEVLYSNLHQRGMQACYNLIEPELFDLQNISDEETHPNIYMSLVLEKYFEAIIEIGNKDTNTLLLNYNQGLISQMRQLENCTLLKFSNSYLEDITERGKYHAKFPEQPFKERQLCTSIDGALLSKLNKLYRETENLRNSKVPVALPPSF